jgi:hypothetical protein
MSEQEIAQLELLKTQSVRPTHPDRQVVSCSSIAEVDAGLVASILSAFESHTSLSDSGIPSVCSGQR